MSESKAQSRPIISVAVSPRNNRGWEKFLETLRQLAHEDPTIRIEKRAMGEPIVISGMSELHLRGICDRIVHEYKIEIDVGEPEVIYLETIQNQAEGEGKFIRQAGGHGWYAHVKIRLEPRELGRGYEFADQITDGAVPPQFVESVNSGIQEAMKAGVLDRREMVDLRAVLCDGSYHESDSNEFAFKIAGSEAFIAVAAKANPVLLEPMMSAKVIVAEEYVGVIIGDLNRRRGLIKGMDYNQGSQVIDFSAPLAEMLGYAIHIRSMTQGRASCSMQFAGYAVAPLTERWGDDEAGITANKPKGPTPRRGSASAPLEFE